MIRDTPRHAGTPGAPLLRWVLQRDSTHAITCELDARANRCYEVCVLPHWDPASAMIERFEAPTPALLRHAEIASRLRENGWIVVDHVAAEIHAAA